MNSNLDRIGRFAICILALFTIWVSVKRICDTCITVEAIHCKVINPFKK